MISISHPTDRPNFSRVQFRGMTVWFSYDTPIAFQASYGLRMSKNLWGPTTGKHLNLISTTANEFGVSAERLDREDFERELEDALARRVMEVR